MNEAEKGKKIKIKILNLLYIDDCDDWDNISPKAVTEDLRKYRLEVGK